MAYSAGNAAGIVQLLDALRVFLLAQGWTVNLNAADGAGQRLHVSKGAHFVNFRACVNENPFDNSLRPDVESASNLFGLWMNPSTAYDAGAAWYAQTDAPRVFRNPPTNTTFRYLYSGINSITGAVNYWLFTFADCVYMVVENPTGRFHWLAFGGITKVGAWTGGTFTFAKHSPSESSNTTKTIGFAGRSYTGQGSSRGFLRVGAFDGETGWSATELISNRANIVGMRFADSFQKMRRQWLTAPNLFNSQSVLFPVAALMTRDGANFVGSTPFSLLGYFEGLNFLNIKALTPAAEYTLSTDLYRVFSFHEKADEVPITNPNFSAGNLGFALRTN